MNPAEIEETIKCHVQAKLDEYDIDATIIDAVVVGSRCRGLEKDSFDLDVVVELSTNEREDDLFNAFNEDGLHIGEVKVDINPITAQHTGTLEPYLPQAEKPQNYREWICLWIIEWNGLSRGMNWLMPLFSLDSRRNLVHRLQNSWEVRRQ